MKQHPIRVLALALAFTTLALTAAAVRTSPGDAGGVRTSPSDAPATRTSPGKVAAKKPLITVYKDPGCGCCKSWIEHLVKHGYRVDAKDSPDMTEIKRTLGVPTGLTACHTAIVNGYLIEGHVPAADIGRLLEQKPKIAGLAVPGMPMGSPGMEGGPPERYQVLAFDKTGKTTVFASH